MSHVLRWSLVQPESKTNLCINASHPKAFIPLINIKTVFSMNSIRNCKISLVISICFPRSTRHRSPWASGPTGKMQTKWLHPCFAPHQPGLSCILGTFIQRLLHKRMWKFRMSFLMYCHIQGCVVIIYRSYFYSLFHNHHSTSVCVHNISFYFILYVTKCTITY